MVRSPSNLYDVEDTSVALGETNEVFWPKIHITERLRFPFPALVHQFFQYMRIHPVYVHVNVIRVLRGVSILNLRHNLNLGVRGPFVHLFSKKHPSGRFFFMIDAKPVKIATNLPGTTKHKAKSLVIISGVV